MDESDIKEGLHELREDLRCCRREIVELKVQLARQKGATAWMSGGAAGGIVGLLEVIRWFALGS